MKRLPFAFACSPYDRVRPIMDGSVPVEGMDFNFIPLVVEETFWRQLRHQEFDGSEMSLSSYIMAASRGDDRFVAIPAFTSRSFRHSGIFINVHKGIRKPEDLKGKRIGVPEYQLTAAVWQRGLLQHEYDVHPRDIRWKSGGEETPGRGEKLKIELPNDIDYAPIPEEKTLSGMLDAGEIDALLAPRAPSCFVNGSLNVKRLWENYREVEADYYRRTRIFPIMHCVVIKHSVYKESPWVAQSLYKALLAAKNITLKNLQTTEALHATLPWLVFETQRTKEIMGE
ncbi:MAG TPA: hypothetical protein VLW86_04085, partial [Syntrophorhabdales bacterium]|nr:hypothetical protein [Syntrophorhabdales bacterium]